MSSPIRDPCRSVKYASKAGRHYSSHATQIRGTISHTDSQHWRGFAATSSHAVLSDHTISADFYAGSHCLPPCAGAEKAPFALYGLSYAG